MEELRRKDWALLVLASAEGEPLQPVQLQKCLFLIGENVKPAARGLSRDYYAFEPYAYGPFDHEAYRDAEKLEQHGLALVATRPGRSYREYSATAAGIDRARSLERQLPAPVVDYVRRVVAWARSLSFSDLVRAIYQKYPDQRARSVFNG